MRNGTGCLHQSLVVTRVSHISVHTMDSFTAMRFNGISGWHDAGREMEVSLVNSEQTLQLDKGSLALTIWTCQGYFEG